MAFIGRTYLRLLRTHTLVTQMATSGVVFSLGDCLSQQVIEKRRLQDHDISRTGRFFTYGAFIWAPIANRWYNINNKVTLGYFPATVAARVGLDATLFAPFSVAGFFSAMGLLEGRTLMEIKSRLQENWLPVYLNCIMVFGPTQVINMSFMPLYARPPFMNIVSLGWNCYLATYNQRVQSENIRPQDPPIDLVAKIIV